MFSEMLILIAAAGWFQAMKAAYPRARHLQQLRELRLAHERGLSPFQSHLWALLLTH